MNEREENTAMFEDEGGLLFSHIWGYYYDADGRQEAVVVGIGMYPCHACLSNIPCEIWQPWKGNITLCY